MASVSVVHFNTSSPHKVLQQNNTTNNAERREIIILRKNPHILPQTKDHSRDDILITNTGRKKPRSGKEIRTQPPPIAVARRNARERNRVKQVNNGFANLRQHIPNFIASTFESNTRGGSKKLSKVETLRMAVEYIRSLEDLLALDDHSETNNISNSSLSPYSSPSSSSNIQYHQILSPPPEDDDLSSNATPSPQYIRIDAASYQIIPSNIYDDSENLEPLNILSESDLEFAHHGQDLLSGMHASDSLSPGMYSEQSLSPGLIEKQILETNCGGIGIKTELDHVVKNEIVEEVPVISLKTEHELSQQHKSNVLNVMQWWEQQQLHHGGGGGSSAS